MTGNVINIVDLQVPSSGAVLNYLFFNTRFSNIANAINGVALRQDTYDVAVNDLVSTGLDRINTVLGPLLSELQEASTVGFLTSPAVTGTALALSNGLAVQVTLTSPALASFTPTPWLLLSDNNNVNNWAILSYTTYNNTTGVLVGSCVYVNSPGIASTNWTVSCQPAVIPAMQTLLSSAQTAASNAATSASTVSSQMAALNAALASIQAGPVASVAGRTGVVVLQISDIVNLTSTIAGLATIVSLNNGLATKQNSSSILSSLAGLSINANTIPIGTSVGTLGLISSPLFGQKFVSATDINSLATATGIASQSMLGTAAAKALATQASIRADNDTNVITTDQAWAAGQWVNVGNIAGGVTIDCSTGLRFYATLVGNVTLSFMNLKAGQSIMVMLLQDTLGGRTVSWSGATIFYWPNGTVPSVSTAANSTAIIGMFQEFNGALIANGWHF